MKHRSRLRTNKPLRRRAPLCAVSPKKAATTSWSARPRDTGPDRSTRELVKERDDWACSVCGRPLLNEQASVHHRRNRGQGGSSDPAINRPSNLLLVCGTGTTGCHGWIGQHITEADALGFVVSLNSIADPAEMPVCHAVHGWVLLGDDGTVQPVSHADGEAA